jgi:hypothetical protein
MSKATELATRARRIQKILSANETTDTMRVIEFCAESATEFDRLQAIEAAARNLVKVKGRYHTEQAFKTLAALLVNTTDDRPSVRSI